MKQFNKNSIRAKYINILQLPSAIGNRVWSTWKVTGRGKTKNLRPLSVTVPHRSSRSAHTGTRQRIRDYGMGRRGLTTRCRTGSTCSMMRIEQLDAKHVVQHNSEYWTTENHNHITQKYCPLDRVNWKHAAKSTRSKSVPQYKKQYYTNIGLGSGHFRVTAYWWLQKMLNASDSIIHVGTSGDTHLRPHFLPLLLTGALCHVGTSGNTHLRPHFLPPRLTGALCHDLFRNFLPELLQRVNLQTSILLWSMQDNAPQHFLFAVRNSRTTFGQNKR